VADNAHATVFEEQAEILAHVTHPGEQFVMRLHAPKTALAAKPGQFVHCLYTHLTLPTSDLV